MATSRIKLFELSAALAGKLNVRGHDIYQKNVFSLLIDRTPKEITGISKAMVNPPLNAIKIGSSSLMECSKCGEAPTFSFNGKEVLATPCKYAKGVPPFTFFLNIPSGKLVIENDLREQFRCFSNFNVNTTEGQKLTTEYYATLGLAHGFVGNSCPSLYKINAKTYTIGVKAPKTNAKKITTICTDLWWYSLCDYNELSRRTKDIEAFTYVDVVPGVYKFSHLYHKLDKTKSDRLNSTYTKIERVRTPDPIIDLQAKEFALNYTAGQILGDAITEWGNKKLSLVSNIIRKADHCMCTIGNGYNVHINGWAGSKPYLPSDSKTVHIPNFEVAHKWYPLSKYSLLIQASKKDGPKLNKSFVQLAFNICRAILVFGVDTTYSGKINREKKRKSNALEMKLAWLAYLGLKKLYPSWIPLNAVNLPNPKYWKHTKYNTVEIWLQSDNSKYFYGKYVLFKPYSGILFSSKSKRACKKELISLTKYKGLAGPDIEIIYVPET